MTSRWEVRCQFSNLFMQEHGDKCTVEVHADDESAAKRKAQLEACHKLGISTMMHGGVKILSIKKLSR